MTKEEIFQYNKMCAEFLGYKNTTPTDPDFSIYENGKTPMVICGLTLTLLEPMSMQFHSDWNWIMEVVEAIEKLNFNIRISCTCVTIENAFDNDSNLKPIYKFHSIQGEFETKKEAVVTAINQFLIWYNNKQNLSEL